MKIDKLIKQNRGSMLHLQQLHNAQEMINLDGMKHFLITNRKNIIIEWEESPNFSITTYTIEWDEKEVSQIPDKIAELIFKHQH